MALVGRVRVLLSEGSSLTAREVLTCLGPAGFHLQALDPHPLCIARFSRWMRRVHRCPPAGADPVGYLEAVRRVAAERRIDVVLPTHEQAWLFAAGPLRSGVPVAVADMASFGRVQTKIEFARLLDELGLAQPGWRLIRDRRSIEDLPFPYWLKSAFSTAGRGVRLVTDERSRTITGRELLEPAGAPVMAQEPANGQYGGQVQGLFDRGRLGAVHTSVQTGTGIGPSAAARLSVDHPIPRRDIAVLGEALGWHGGLTLDYLHQSGEPSYIECNPRTVEPGNAAASGLNLPELQIRLTTGEGLPSVPRTGRPGVRTHGTLALILAPPHTTERGGR